jgi:hypothetical protein
MADIFISYSSKDRGKAEQLTELLASAGLSVWIDKHGIEAATSWSSEIVDAIDATKVLIVLLSSNSVTSVNVVKEVSLAAEQKKKILPLDLEPVELPRDLRYHLAGIQRSPMTNIDAIIRALARLGLEATNSPTIKLVKETDGRTSLMRISRQPQITAGLQMVSSANLSASSRIFVRFALLITKRHVSSRIIMASSQPMHAP